MSERVRPDGNHLSLDGRPWRARGVTYGTFKPRLDGALFPERSQVKLDLNAISEAGFNTVRTYTVPPPDVIEIAEELCLRLIVGVYYDDWRMVDVVGKKGHRKVLERGLEAVDRALEVCAGKDSVLALSVGNEVPADLVRLHGIGGVEDVLGRLIERVHEGDPGMPATYTNFPTTEFLDPPGQDLICFNVFLEDRDALARYLRHLQIVAEDKPLIITELGLAAAVNGEEAQARSLRWQLRTTDEAGCAGVTIFSWTDEWAVDAKEVTGWGFGLTDEDRIPRPALSIASEWARSGIADVRSEWPSMTVLVCAHNESRAIKSCLASLQDCDYPGLEVIVCDDGSTDDTVSIARRFPFQILELPHGGLSNARNAGIRAARGEIVAFLDADAQCHPEWPFHLALSLLDGVAATGGPNLPVEDGSLTEQVIAASPGGPMHVLSHDDRAEHVPGCNMAFRAKTLAEIGGFDPVYVSAGDDVDVCWKILDRGMEIGFSAAAQIRHHRRDSIRGYLKQQRGYGRAERLLSRRHRHRFNRLGQARWSGFIYGGARLMPALLKPVIYHGYMGSAPFQQVVHRPSENAWGRAASILPLVVPLVALAALAPLSAWWLAAAAATLLAVLVYGVGVALQVSPPPGMGSALRFRISVAAMHVVQPLVRAWGRITKPSDAPRASGPANWTGDRYDWIKGLQRAAVERGCVVHSGDPNDSFDIELWKGPLLGARITTAISWGWKPHFKVRYRPRAVAVGGLEIALVIAFLGSPLTGALVAGLTIALSSVEFLVLRRDVKRCLRATLTGAPS